MAVIVKKSNSFQNVDAGVYEAVVTGIEVAESGRGKYLRWSFKIKDPIIDGEESDDEFIVTGNAPLKLFDGSKLDVWCKAMGIDASEGDDVDLEDGIGELVMVTIATKTKDDKTYSNVTDVNKIRRKKKGAVEKKKTKKSEPEDDFEDDDEDSPPPKKKSAKPVEKKKTKKLEPEDDDDEDGLDDDDDELDDDLDDDDLDDLTDLDDDDDDE